LAKSIGPGYNKKFQLMPRNREHVSEAVCELTWDSGGLNPRPVLQLTTPPPAHVIFVPPGGWRNPLAAICGTIALIMLQNMQHSNAKVQKNR